MRIVISILLLFITSVFAQGDTIGDPLQCSDSCTVDAYARTSALTTCTDLFDLPCICSRPDFEPAFAFCLRWTCQAVQDTAAQYHREQCASATQGGGQSSPPAPPSASATAPPPPTTTPLLSSIINALTSTGDGATTTRAGGSSSTTSRSGGVESISSQRAGMYAAIVASGVMMVFYINGY